MKGLIASLIVIILSILGIIFKPFQYCFIFSIVLLFFGVIVLLRSLIGGHKNE